MQPSLASLAHLASTGSPSTIAIYAIAVAALLGVVLHPWRAPEAIWAVLGACALCVVGLVPWPAAWTAIGKGNDVYLFLAGMMLLSALAEREGLFDHVAAVCVQRARGSPTRLFALVYAAGTVVTVFMSNDATAVVLTPAVLAVTRKANAKPLPYLLICALIANAASFVLPIANPANFVVFGSQLPSLPHWVQRFLLPSVLSIGVTYVALRWLSRRDLVQPIATDVDVPALSPSGRLAAGGIVVVALVLTLASTFGAALGAPTLITSTLVWLAIAMRKRESPWPVLREISWAILPLVAGLFVIVEGLDRAGLLAVLAHQLEHAAHISSSSGAAIGAGAIVAIACNLMNNLPAGLIAGSVVAAAGVDTIVQSAIAIGIDLGPNLSVSGSLATILWLTALRKQGQAVSGWAFFKVGVVVMPLALVAALGALWLQNLL